MIFHCVAKARIAESSPRRSGTVLSIDARPRARNIIAKVAMNGWTLKYWMSMPEARPIADPMRIISRMTT